MILAIDIGNSHIVFGGVDGERIYFQARLSTDSNKTEDEYAVIFKDLLEIHGIDRHKVEGAILSTVVPPLIQVMRGAIRKLTHKELLVVGPGIKTGLNILLDNPGQMGGDLVVGAVAALAEHTPPLIILDVGTATTISVIDRKGNFRGGQILPGIRLSLEALTSHTSLLQQISLEAPGKVIGTNTEDSMRSGLIFGNACMLDGLIDRIEEELGEKATVLATGGLAGTIIPHCRREIILEDDLLIKGLWLVYKKNMK